MTCFWVYFLVSVCYVCVLLFILAHILFFGTSFPFPKTWDKGNKKTRKEEFFLLLLALLFLRCHDWFLGVDSWFLLLDFLGIVGYRNAHQSGTNLRNKYHTNRSNFIDHHTKLMCFVFISGRRIRSFRGQKTHMVPQSYGAGYFGSFVIAAHSHEGRIDAWGLFRKNTKKTRDLCPWKQPILIFRMIFSPIDFNWFSLVGYVSSI